MPSITVRPDPQQFPVGATFAAYSAPSGWSVERRSGPPPGALVQSVTVGSDGTATFTALAYGTEYVGYASSPDRYWRFEASGSPDLLSGRVDAVESGKVPKADAAVNAHDYGYTGLGLVNETTQFQAFLDASAGKVGFVPPGTLIHGQLTVPSNTTILAYGLLRKPTGLTTKGAVNFGTGNFTQSGGLPITVDGVEGAFTLTMSSGNAATFTAGDLVQIMDPTTTTGSGLGLCTQETNVVASIATGVVTFKYPLNFNYTVAAGTTVAKSVGGAVNSHWFGGSSDHTSVTDDGLGVGDHCDFNLWGCVNSSVNDVSVSNHAYKLAQIHRSLNCHIRRAVASAPTVVTAGRGYNTTISFSRHCSMDRLTGVNVRHTSDIFGGSDCWGVNCVSHGRTSDPSQVAHYLHGGLSKRCRLHGFASNAVWGAGAGNATFGADLDFQLDVVTDGCDEGVLVNMASTGKILGRSDDATNRGLNVQTGCDVEVDFLCDGGGTPASALGLAHFSDSKVRGRLRVRSCKERSIGVGGTASDVDLDVDVDHPSTASTVAAVRVSLDATSRLKLRGKVKSNNASVRGVHVDDVAGSVVDVNADHTGTALQAVYLDGAGTDRIVQGSTRGAGFAESIRSNNGEVVVDNFSFAPSGTCLTAAGTTSKVTLGQGVKYTGTTNARLANAVSATVVGGHNVQNGNTEVGAPPADAAFTLSPRTSQKHTIHTGTLTANRVVSLNTTDAWNGCRFKITRTGGGAFTLDVGTGPLKSLSTGQWGEFTYDGSTWKLTAFGSL